ncbi:MAG: hypothetical protein ACRDC3_09510 [Paraclostridium dentum]
MDTNEGKILSFTIEGDGGMNFFSRNYDGQVVFWNDIIKIGCDTIIVNQGQDHSLDEFNI